MDYRFLLARPRNGDLAPRQRLLHTNLRLAIATGRLAQRHRLPSSRELAEQLDIARNTVVYAYEQLCAEGYLVSNRRGTVVAALRAPPPRKPGTIRRTVRLSSRMCHVTPHRDTSHLLLPFTPGSSAIDAFPVLEWQSMIRRAFREIQPRDLAYGEPEGVAALRAAIADRVRAVRSLRCITDQIIVTDGTQTALDICTRLLTEEKDVVWMENPGYTGARSIFEVAGVNIQPIPVDAHGAMVAGLREYPAPRLIYLTPSHQYPMGGVLSLSRRMAFLTHAQKHGAWILEDDYDSDFRYDGEPLPALQGLIEDAPVIYIGTFSKTMFPGLRLGYLVVPEELVAPLRAVLARLIHPGRQIEQAALARFMIEGRYTRHLSRMRKLYKERQRALRDALTKQLPELTVLGVTAGLHLVLLLPRGFDDLALCNRARRRGLNPQPLSAHSDGGANKQPGLILGYGNTPADTMNRHIRALAACID